jgi:putative Holliday junction resolvase
MTDSLDPSEVYRSAPLRGRVMALDVGTVRIGVALSDPTGTFAQPKDTLLRYKKPEERIAQLIEEHEVQTLVVGQPLTLRGEAGPAVAAIAAFVTGLQNHVQVPIVMWDERLSTAHAQRDMIALGARRATRRQHIDKVAAALILQSYLDSRATLP